MNNFKLTVFDKNCNSTFTNKIPTNSNETTDYTVTLIELINKLKPYNFDIANSELTAIIILGGRNENERSIVIESL